MSIFKGTKKGKGGSLTEKLVFYTGSEYDYFSHDSLREKMSEHKGIDHSEKLQKMWLFQRPLSEWQRTQLVWNHQFVVIDLPGWYCPLRERVKHFSFKRM